VKPLRGPLAALGVTPGPGFPEGHHRIDSNILGINRTIRSCRSPAFLWDIRVATGRIVRPGRRTVSRNAVRSDGTAREHPITGYRELTIIPRKIGEFVTEAGFDGAYDFSAITVREVFGKNEDIGKLSFIAKEAKQFYPSPRAMMAPIDNYEDAFASISKEQKFTTRMRR
jgi:hypothetical protein